MTFRESLPMTILVTGAAGFIGRSVVAELSSRGHSVKAMVRRREQTDLFKDIASVTAVVADVNEPTTLMESMQGVDAVIHLAGIVWGDTSKMHGTMVEGTRNLIEAMHQASVARLILVSSLAVYDWTKVENTLNELAPLVQDASDRQGPYSHAKVAQELLGRSLCEQYGIRLTLFRPGGVVAPDNSDAADLGPRVGPIQFVVSPGRRLRIVNVLHVADVLATACVVDLPNGFTVNLVDDAFVTAWKFASRLRNTGDKAFRITIPVPYRFIMGFAHLSYRLAKLIGLESLVPGLLCPSRIACRFKAVDCDISLWRKYVPLTSDQPFLALLTDSSSVLPTGNSQGMEKSTL